MLDLPGNAEGGGGGVSKSTTRTEPVVLFMEISL